MRGIRLCICPFEWINCFSSCALHCRASNSQLIRTPAIDRMELATKRRTNKLRSSPGPIEPVTSFFFRTDLGKESTYTGSLTPIYQSGSLLSDILISLSYLEASLFTSRSLSFLRVQKRFLAFLCPASGLTLMIKIAHVTYSKECFCETISKNGSQVGIAIHTIRIRRQMSWLFALLEPVNSDLKESILY